MADGRETRSTMIGLTRSRRQGHETRRSLLSPWRGSGSLTESDLVRRILWRETPAASDGKLESAGAALQRSFARMTDALRNSMGAGGCSALLARAFALAEIAHPILKELRPRNGDSLC